MPEKPHNSSSTPQSPKQAAPNDDVHQHRHGKAPASTTDPTDRRSAALSTLTSQAEDPNKIKDAVVSSANMACNIWVVFLAVGTYLVVAADPGTDSGDAGIAKIDEKIHLAHAFVDAAERKADCPGLQEIDTVSVCFNAQMGRPTGARGRSSGK